MIIEKIGELDTWMELLSKISGRNSNSQYYTDNYGRIEEYLYFKCKKSYEETYRVYGITFYEKDYWIIKGGIDLGKYNNGKLIKSPSLDKLKSIEELIGVNYD